MKKILRAIVLILILGIAGGAAWWLWRPQVVTLRDGTKLTLVGATYGSRQNWPTMKYSERDNPRAFDGDAGTLVVWIRKKTVSDNPQDYQVYVQDTASTACVPSSDDNSRDISDDEQMIGYRLDVFPRREGKFYLRIMQDVRGKPVEAGKFVVSNPARGKTFTPWTAAALPAVQTDGDLSVTLTHLGFGPTDNGNDALPKSDPLNQFVIASFQFDQSGTASSNWDLASIQTSDATGNRLDADNTDTTDDNGLQLDYQWGLWPNEPAWKLRAEFVKKSGFTDDELVTFTNVPIVVLATNAPNQPDPNEPAADEISVAGSDVKIFSARQNAANPQRNRAARTRLRINITPFPDNLHFTPVKVTDDQNREIAIGGVNDNGNGDFTLGLRNPGDAKSLDVTFAVDRSRFVEFTAKPVKEAAQ